MTGRRRALVLTAFQAADLAVTQVSPKYGSRHLDYLGVPANLRPALPVIKAAAVVGLVASANRAPLRRFVGAALLSYYAAAVTFHVGAGDGVKDVAPAVACATLAASLV